MTTKDNIWRLIERYRTAGGREEHHAFKDMLDIELEYLCDFRDRVIDELVIIGIYNSKHDFDAKQALNDAIQWNVDAALDPKVSKAAQMLVSQGYDRGWNDSTVGDNW